MKNEFYENWAIVFMSYLFTSLLFITVIWGSEGFPVGEFTELDIILIITQLISAGVILIVPLVYIFLSQFKIVRRE